MNATFQETATTIPQSLSEFDVEIVVPRGLTVAEYANAKNLPEQFLREKFGLKDTDGAVEMPYKFADGTFFRSKLRPSMDKDAHRMVWLGEKKPITVPYGVWLTRPGAKVIMVVEGESDTQTLHFHELNGVGISGANGWKPEFADLSCFADADKIYVVQEPGQAGTDFIRAIASTKLQPKLRAVTLPVKDVSDLHQSTDHNGFLSALRIATEKSAPVVRGPHKKVEDTGIPSEITGGSRNQKLTSLAGKVWRAGITLEALELDLLQKNETFCKPPLSKAEVIGIARSISKYKQPIEPPVTEPLSRTSSEVNKESQAVPKKPNEQPNKDQSPRPKNAYTLDTVLASSIEPMPQEWLWENRIPRDTLSTFVGEPDKGKGVVSVDLIARLSTGRDMPDGTVNPYGQPVECLMMVAEDSLDTALVPRLISAEANLDKVHVVKSVSRRGEKDNTKRQLYLDTDMRLIRDKLTEHPEIKLVTIDPVSNYLGDANINREQQVRRVLTPVRDLAEDLKVTFLCIAHFNKNTAQNVINRTGGAMAMTGLPRASWCFVSDPDNRDKYLMLPVKKNVGKKVRGLSYTIVEHFISVQHIDKPLSVPKLVWGGAVESDTNDILQSVDDPEERGVRKAKRFLQEILSNGAMLSKDIYKASEEDGIANATLRRAKTELKVKSERVGEQWYMRLSDGQGAQKGKSEHLEGEHLDEDENLF